MECVLEEQGERYVANIPNYAKVILIIGFIVLICIGLYIIYKYFLHREQLQKSEGIPPPIQLGRHEDPGASSDGKVDLNNGKSFQDTHACSRGFNRAHDHTGSRGYHCNCKTPFYENKCHLESHSNKYYAVGDSSGDIVIDRMQETKVDRLSFPYQDDLGKFCETTCSGLCDNDDNCTGFIYTPNSDIVKMGIAHEDEENPGDSRCVTFRSEPIVTGIGPQYSHNTQSQLYMKKGHRIKTVDRAYLYSGVLPLRFSLEKDFQLNGNRAIEIKDSVPMHISGPNLPNRIINDPEWYGVLSRNRLTTPNAQAKILGRSTDHIIITPQSTSFVVPESWNNYWAVFFPFPDASFGNGVSENNCDRDFD